MTACKRQICISLILPLFGPWCLFFTGMVGWVTFRPESAIVTGSS